MTIEQKIARLANTRRQILQDEIKEMHGELVLGLEGEPGGETGPTKDEVYCAVAAPKALAMREAFDYGDWEEVLECLSDVIELARMAEAAALFAPAHRSIAALQPTLNDRSCH